MKNFQLFFGKPRKLVYFEGRMNLENKPKKGRTGGRAAKKPGVKKAQESIGLPQWMWDAVDEHIARCPRIDSRNEYVQRLIEKDLKLDPLDPVNSPETSSDAGTSTIHDLTKAAIRKVKGGQQA
jgi:hypothetical protein